MKSESAPLLVLSTPITQESSTLERFLQSTPICLSFGYHPKMSKRPSGIVFQTKAARFLGKQILCRKFQLESILPSRLVQRGKNIPPYFELSLTTKPHDKHHFGGDFMITEKVEQVGKWKNIHCSTKQNKYLKNKNQSKRLTDVLQSPRPELHCIWLVLAKVNKPLSPTSLINRPCC